MSSPADSSATSVYGARADSDPMRASTVTLTDPRRAPGACSGAGDCPVAVGHPAHRRWGRRWWPKNRWPRSIDRWRAALAKAIPVVVVEGAARVPGPPNIPRAPVSVERERDDRYSDHRRAGRYDYRTGGSGRLQEGRVHPTAVQTERHVAPA